MLSFVAGAALAFVATDDAAKELADIATKTAKAESYEFTSKSENDFGGGRGGGGERTPTPATKGAFKKGMPMKLTSGETEAYKDGDQVVYKNEEGKWTTFDRSSFGRGGGRGGRGGGEGGRGGAEGRGGRGGRGGGEGGEGGGEGRGGREGGEGRGERGGEGRGGREGGGERGGRGSFGGFSRGGVFSLMGVTAPHEMFAAFADKVTDVKKEEKDGKVVFTGTLTEKGTESLSGGRGFGRGGRGGGGGGGPEMKSSGTFTIEVKDGTINSAVFSTKRSGSFGERTFEFSSTRTLTFSKVGETKLEVPADVLSQFEI